MVNPKTNKKLSISVCNHAPNKIKIMDKICNFDCVNGDMYVFKRCSQYIAINLIDTYVVLYIKGYMRSDGTLSTGTIYNMVGLPGERRLWSSRSLYDSSIRKYGKVYWNQNTKLFYYEAKYVNTGHWNYVVDQTKLIGMKEVT